MARVGEGRGRALEGVTECSGDGKGEDLREFVASDREAVSQ